MRSSEETCFHFHRGCFDHTLSLAAVQAWMAMRLGLAKTDGEPGHLCKFNVGLSGVSPQMTGNGLTFYPSTVRLIVANMEPHECRLLSGLRWEHRRSQKDQVGGIIRGVTVGPSYSSSRAWWRQERLVAALAAAKESNPVASVARSLVCVKQVQSRLTMTLCIAPAFWQQETYSSGSPLSFLDPDSFLQDPQGAIDFHLWELIRSAAQTGRPGAYYVQASFLEQEV